MIAQIIPFRYPQKQLPKAKEGEKFTLARKEKPREKVNILAQWTHKQHCGLSGSQFQFYRRKAGRESVDCAVKERAFPTQGICMGAAPMLPKALHGSLANRHTGKYANGGCPKDNGTDTHSMVTVTQLFA